MNPPYPSDAQAKAEILDAGRKIYQRGLVAANDGNLSVRVGDNSLWVTPTSVSKGAMTEDMLVKLSLDGTVLEGTRKPSSETKMHLRIYQENPAVRAVVHAHPPAATAFAAAGLPLDRPVLQEAVVQLGTVPVAPLPCPVPRRWRTASPLLPGVPGPAAGIPRRGHLGNLHGAGSTTVWNVWNSWPPSPSTCGLWAFIARCRSLWLRRWRGCAPPGASSDPAAVLSPFGEGFPFPPAYWGQFHTAYTKLFLKKQQKSQNFCKIFQKMMDRTGNLYYYINENGQKKTVCPL
ncbi:MAG: class II aldolase/adducin family protein [Evtepia gabavorous]